MEHLERLLIDMKKSLRREMRRGFDQITARFDAMESESVLEEPDRQITELSERIKRLAERRQ